MPSVSKVYVNFTSNSVLPCTNSKLKLLIKLLCTTRVKSRHGKLSKRPIMLVVLSIIFLGNVFGCSSDTLKCFLLVSLTKIFLFVKQINNSILITKVKIVTKGNFLKLQEKTNARMIPGE